MPEAKWKKFTDEQIRQFVKESISIRQLQVKLGYDEKSGSASNTIKNMLDKKGIDYSHFKGQAWNKKDEYASWSAIKENFLKTHEYKCECCGISKWNNKRLTLQLHHIDGNRRNNNEENLQLLCPNCHSQTDNYCTKNKYKANKISDEDFLEILKYSTSICAACREAEITPNQTNYARARRLLEDYQEEENEAKQE